MFDTVKYWRNRIASHGSVNTTPTDKEGIHYIERELILKYVPDECLILDYGVGGGRLFPLYSEMRLKVQGWEVADHKEIIEERKKKSTFTYYHYVEDEICVLPHPDKQFEACICFAVLLHQTPDNIEMVISEICRVSKLVIASVYEPLEKPKKIDAHCFTYDYKAIFEKLGITIIEEKRINPNSIFYVIKYESKNIN